MDATRLADRLRCARLTGGVEAVVGPAALREALGYVHDSYVQAGLIGTSALRLRVRPWEHDPRMATWAWRDDDGRLRGVLSLIRDGPLGLPCDHVVPEVVSALRASGPVGCASNLCADGGMGAIVRMRIVLGLVLAAYERAAATGMAHCIAAVSPGHADMLERICGFAAIGESVVYPPHPVVTGSAAGAAEDVVQVLVMDIEGEAERMRELQEALHE
jgi:hypothetical protein